MQNYPSDAPAMFNEKTMRDSPANYKLLYVADLTPTTCWGLVQCMLESCGQSVAIALGIYNGKQQYTGIPEFHCYLPDHVYFSDPEYPYTQWSRWRQKNKKSGSVKNRL